MADVAPAPAAPATAPAQPPAAPKPEAPPQNQIPATQLKPSKQVKPAAPATESAQPGEAPKEEFFDLVVNGKPKRLTKEQAIRELQKGEASSKRFQQAAELTKKTQALLQALQGDDAEAALEHLLGERLDSIAEARLTRRIQSQMMSPEERERATLQEKLKAYETREQRRQADEQKTQQEAQMKTVREHFDKTLSALVDKAGLPPEPAILEMAAQLGLEALDYEEAGVNLTQDQLVAELKERVESASKDREQRIASGLKGDALLSHLGEATVKAVIDAVTEKYAAANPYKATAPKSEPAPVAPGEKLSESDYKKWLKEKMGI